MTEPDWLTSTDPLAMLSFLRDRGPVSERKLRLFAVACCRRITLGMSPNGLKAITAAEMFADGLITALRLNEAWVAVRHPKSFATSPGGRAVRAACCPPWNDPAIQVAADAAYAAVRLYDPRARDELVSREQSAQTALVRDIFGNPFRPAPFDRGWRTEAVVSLARGIYEERAFERLPVLADALEDAGCTDVDILAHCRGGGPHVRGCWVVDMVLGKA